MPLPFAEVTVAIDNGRFVSQNATVRGLGGVAGATRDEFCARAANVVLGNHECIRSVTFRGPSRNEKTVVSRPLPCEA